MSIRKHPPKSEVKQLMLLLTVSVLTSFLLVVGMLWHYSSNNALKVEEVLLSPDAIVKIPKKVDRIEWNGKKIDLATFDKMYRMIQHDRSIDVPHNELVKTEVDTLSIVDKDGKKIQGVKFSGHYFFIEGQDSSEPHLIYYHPEIQKEAHAVINQ